MDEQDRQDEVQVTFQTTIVSECCATLLVKYDPSQEPISSPLIRLICQSSACSPPSVTRHRFNRLPSSRGQFSSVQVMKTCP
jgi:hypothetical protein